MKTKYWIGVVAIALALAFFLGRCNAPTTTITELNKRIDSLRVAARSTEKKMESAENRAISAELNARDLAARRPELKIIYRKDTAFSHAQPKKKKDSISRVLTGVSASDSSELTNDFADGVLDLGSTVKLLRADTSLLVHINRELDSSNDFYALALDECNKLVKNLESQAVAIKQKGDKVKWWEWVILGAAFVLGLAIP